MESNLEINQDYAMCRELEEKAFMRCVQLIDKHGNDAEGDSKAKVLKVHFSKYDLFDTQIRESDYFEEAPSFVTDEVKNKIILMRIIEEACEENVTELVDILGAVINIDMCKEMIIRTVELNDEEILNIILDKK